MKNAIKFIKVLQTLQGVKDSIEDLDCVTTVYGENPLVLQEKDNCVKAVQLLTIQVVDDYLHGGNNILSKIGELDSVSFTELETYLEKKIQVHADIASQLKQYIAEGKSKETIMKRMQDVWHLSNREEERHKAILEEVIASQNPIA